MSVTKRTKQLAEAIAKTDSIEVVKHLCKGELNFLQDEYRLTSIASYLTRYRSEITAYRARTFAEKVARYKGINSIKKECAKEVRYIIGAHKGGLSRTAFETYTNCIKGIENQHIVSNELYNEFNRVLELDDAPAIQREVFSTDKFAIARAYLRLSIDKQAKIKDSQRVSLSERLDEKRVVTAPEQAISIAKDLLHDKSYMANIIGLCLLTGRRTYEIGRTASFKYIDDNTVLFSGQAKTKNSDDARDNYAIPVLAPAKDIIKSLHALRTKKSFEEITDYMKFHNVVGGNLSKLVKRKLGHVIEKVTMHDLRAFYAEYSFQKFGRNTRIDRSKYYSNVCGHGKKDVTTAVRYARFIIEGV